MFNLIFKFKLVGSLGGIVEDIGRDNAEEAPNSDYLFFVIVFPFFLVPSELKKGAVHRSVTL